jgi:hypothetical protein
LRFEATIQQRGGYVVGSEDQARNGNPPESARFELRSLTDHMAKRAGLDAPARVSIGGIQRQAGNERIQDEVQRLRSGETQAWPVQGRIKRGDE